MPAPIEYVNYVFRASQLNADSGDLDDLPDRVSWSGRIWLRPHLADGDYIRADLPGGPETVSLPDYTMTLNTDGVATHRGVPGIKVPAPAAWSPGQTWQYYVEFDGVKVNGTPIPTPKGYYVEAPAGQVVDLTSVGRVPGTLGDGTAVGPPGRGIFTIEAETGALLITYDDTPTTTQTVPLPGYEDFTASLIEARDEAQASAAAADVSADAAAASQSAAASSAAAAAASATAADASADAAAASQSAAAASATAANTSADAAASSQSAAAASATAADASADAAAASQSAAAASATAADASADAAAASQSAAAASATAADASADAAASSETAAASSAAAADASADAAAASQSAAAASATAAAGSATAAATSASNASASATSASTSAAGAATSATNAANSASAAAASEDAAALSEVDAEAAATAAAASAAAADASADAAALSEADAETAATAAATSATSAATSATEAANSASAASSSEAAAANSATAAADSADDAEAFALAVVAPKFQGTKATYGDLPGSYTSADLNKAWVVAADGKLYVWDGDSWPADGEGVPWVGPEGPPGSGSWKLPVVVAAPGNINVAAPGATIDGQSMTLDDRVLLPAQSTGSERGLWLWKGAATPMQRTPDFEVGSTQVPGTAVFVQKGTSADLILVLTSDSAVTVDTTSHTWGQMPILIDYGSVTGKPASIDALDALTPAADKAPYFTGAGSAALADLTTFGRTLIALADTAAARAALDLEPGTDVQAYSDKLAALAALTWAADKLTYLTGASTAATTDLTSFARTLLDDADAGAMRTTLGLVIGTHVQAYDAELAALAGLTSAADKAPYFTGSGAAALMTVTSFIRTLLDDVDAAAARSTLGLVIGTDVLPKANPVATGTLETPALKVTGGTPGAGKVLTSDASGTATWQTPALTPKRSVARVPNSTVLTSSNSIALQTGLTEVVTASGHSFSSSGITVPAGTYLVTAQVDWNVTNSAVRVPLIYDGSRYHGPVGASNAEDAAILHRYTTVLTLTGNTLLQLGFRVSTTTGSVRTIANSTETYLEVVQIA